jgi:hypothetical protein
VLDLLDRLDLKITFFVVGVDAERQENRVLPEITRRGHEIANHSHEHEPWLHRYDAARLEQELVRSEAALGSCFGQRPLGFRGPGFSWSPALLEQLGQRGYLYDASTFPTWIGPLARAYYFRTTRLTREERNQRNDLFGGFADGFRPLQPYRWQLASGSLIEIPVTTVPLARVPFHLSYLLYLARHSERLMAGYLHLSLLACRVAGVQPSFLLHPLDLLGGDLVPELRFFPAMDLPTDRKVRLMERTLGTIGRSFSIVPMSVHARALSRNDALRVRQPVLVS